MPPKRAIIDALVRAMHQCFHLAVDLLGRERASCHFLSSRAFPSSRRKPGSTNTVDGAGVAAVFMD
jgi:hypothetical protein